MRNETQNTAPVLSWPPSRDKSLQLDRVGFMAIDQHLLTMALEDGPNEESHCIETNVLIRRLF